MTPLVPSPGTVLERDIKAYPDGIVIPIDKPWRWTSADVIRKLKWRAFRHFGSKKLKVGHAGTLDPLASGVLLVCLGPACKMAQTLQDHDKEYIATVRFGATTPSYDLEKEPDRFFPHGHITQEAIEAVLPLFLGEQEQIAPLFSAKSVDGVRAYELARKLYRSGKAGTLDAAALETLHRSRITISSLELLEFRKAGTAAPGFPKPEDDGAGASSRINVANTSNLGLPEAVIKIGCSKGTYIRAFARDLGEALGSGAHLSALVRSRSGNFSLENALSMEEASALFQE